MVHHISNSKAVADCVHVNHRVIIALPSSQANALATPQTTNKNTSIRRHAGHLSFVVDRPSPSARWSAKFGDCSDDTSSDLGGVHLQRGDTNNTLGSRRRHRRILQEPNRPLRYVHIYYILFHLPSLVVRLTIFIVGFVVVGVILGGNG